MPSTQKQKSTTKTSSTVAPWAPQGQLLQQAWGRANNLYKQNADNTYNGEMLAQFSPQQLEDFQRVQDYAANSTIPNATENAGRALTTSGQGAVTGALNALAGYKPIGGTQYNIDAAGQYAENPYMTGQVDAAMRDATRYAGEEVIPGVQRRANAGGNLNSNRAAISEGIVRRGLTDQAGDISATLRGDAYNQGLDRAQNYSTAYNTNMLDAINSRGALGSTTVGQGLEALNNSIAQRGALFEMGGQAGEGLRAANQQRLDNERKKAEYGANSQFDLLNKYYQLIASNNWGSQSTGRSTTNATTQNYASPWQIAGGIASGIGSAASGLGGMPMGGGGGGGFTNFFSGSK